MKIAVVALSVVCALFAIALLGTTTWALVEHGARAQLDNKYRAAICERDDAQGTFAKWSDMYEEASGRAAENLKRAYAAENEAREWKAAAEKFRKLHNDAVTSKPAK